MTSEGIFSVDLATTTPTNPRNTEGDILVMDDGTLMFAWSDYYGGSEDHAGAVISAMHSTDGGYTWGSRFTLQENTSRQNVMSVSFLRSKSGDVLFFYLAKHANDDLDVMVRRSTDGGKTFGEPVLVTADAGYYVMNNARVLQHSSGRILCPTSYALNITDWAQPFHNVMYFSDDDGITWQRGKGEIKMPPSGFKDDRGAMEPGLVELKDNRLLQIIRTQLGQVWRSYSSDIGDTWSPPTPMGVTSPEAPATIARIPGTGRLILAHNPVPEETGFNSAQRTPLMISISDDEGATWRQAKVLESDTSQCYAYTSITFNGDRALFTYYVDAGGWNLSARFTSVPIDWFDTVA